MFKSGRKLPWGKKGALPPAMDQSRDSAFPGATLPSKDSLPISNPNPLPHQHPRCHLPARGLSQLYLRG